MDSSKYSIIFDGIVKGETIENVRQNLAAKCRLSAQLIDALFSGKPLSIKNATNVETAKKYEQMLKNAGVICRIIPPNVELSENQSDQTASKNYPLLPAPYHPIVTQTGYNIEKIDKNLFTLFEPHSYRAEQFRKLRAKLLSPRTGSPPRSIMVTSAVPGEGKSFVSANLAISIAQNVDRHALLIDCDIRMPSIHTRFGFSDVPGLSEYLAGNIPLSSLLLKTMIDKLRILPGGKPPQNPSELLSSDKMADLLEKVKFRYSDRFIIIDSPPPLFTAEANVIARQVEGIIIVVKYGKTPRDLVTEMVEVLGKEKIIGVILNESTYRGIKSKYARRYARYLRDMSED